MEEEKKRQAEIEERKRREKEAADLLDKEISWNHTKSMLMKWSKLLKQRQIMKEVTNLTEMRKFLKRKRITRAFSSTVEEELVEDFLESTLALIEKQDFVSRVAQTYEEMRLRYSTPAYY
jgi:hypothetical protein